MRLNRFLFVCTIFWAATAGLSSCRSQRNITIAGSRIEMTVEWDSVPNPKAMALFAPYKAKVDSVMNPVIGVSAMDMTAERPESLLSNLIADVLRNSTTPYIDRPADVAVINMGGLRNSLGAGEVTYRNVYEILPFENALCILSLRGKDVKELMRDIMKTGGEGLSNVYLTVNKDMDIVDIRIGKDAIDDERLYQVATVDYLAEGNDRMTAFKKAEKRLCFKEATIRDLFIEYVKSETAEGRSLTSQKDGRVVITDN